MASCLHRLALTTEPHRLAQVGFKGGATALHLPQPVKGDACLRTSPHPGEKASGKEMGAPLGQHPPPLHGFPLRDSPSVPARLHPSLRPPRAEESCPKNCPKAERTAFASPHGLWDSHRQVFSTVCSQSMRLIGSSRNPFREQSEYLLLHFTDEKTETQGVRFPKAAGSRILVPALLLPRRVFFFFFCTKYMLEYTAGL